MADFFLDISAVGNEYEAYADTPTTWAVPQDGNGRAGPGHAAAVAIATIDVAGCTASGTGAIGVLGVTVSSTLNASGAALATAIATAINASTTATAAGVCQALLPLNRLVFARVNPGVNTQVQIMLRIAGVDWNGLSPTQANISPAATIGAFAGGANGPFAYIWNFQGAAFGRAGGSAAAPAYGLGPSKTAGTLDPSSVDNIITRTKRDGVDLTYAITTSVSQPTYALSSAGARHFIFDDGTTWPGDDGRLTFNLTSTNGSGGPGLRWTNAVSFLARKKYGFALIYANTAAINAEIRGELTAEEAVFENVILGESLDASNNGQVHFGVAGQRGRFGTGCLIISKTGARQVGAGDNGTNGQVRALWTDTDFEYGQAVTTSIVGPVSDSKDCEFSFYHCRFRDRNAIVNPVLQAPFTAISYGANFKLTFDCCSGVAPFASPAAGSAQRMNAQIFWRMPGTDGDWRMETGAFVTEQRANANFPTLRGVLPSGTPWSIKTLLRDLGSTGISYSPLTLTPRYRGATGVKTITVEMLVPTGVSFTAATLGMLVSYTKTDGTIAQESTLASAGAARLGAVAGLAAGIGIGGANQWVLNGAVNLQSVKLTLTTASAILAGSRLNIKLMVRGRLPGNVDRTIYVDTEPTFT